MSEGETEVIASHLSERLKATQGTTDVGEGAEKGEPWGAVGGSANWCSGSGERSGGFSKSQKENYPTIREPHYSPKEYDNTNLKRPMFTAALSTVARLWKQLKCPATDERIEAVVDVCSGILLSHKRMRSRRLQ